MTEARDRSPRPRPRLRPMPFPVPLLSAPAAALLLAGAAAAVLLALRARRRPSEDAPARPEKPVPAGPPWDVNEPPPEVDAERLRRVTLLLRERYAFDELEEFQLVRDLRFYLARCPAEMEDGPTLDRVLLLALRDAIARLEEEGVPREIAGQRRAEVFTWCREAVAWDELPATAAAALAFLEAESRTGSARPR